MSKIVRQVMSVFLLFCMYCLIMPCSITHAATPISEYTYYGVSMNISDDSDVVIFDKKICYGDFTSATENFDVDAGIYYLNVEGTLTVAAFDNEVVESKASWEVQYAAGSDTEVTEFKSSHLSTNYQSLLDLGIKSLADNSELVIKTAGVQAGVSFNGNVEASVVSITVPLAVPVIINPNAEELVNVGDFLIVNHSLMPVKITLQSLTQVSGFENVVAPTGLPDELSWDSLNKSNCDKYFSLGIKPVDKDTYVWKSKAATDYVYALTSFSPTVLGVLGGESKSELGLDIHCGKTFVSSKSAKFKVVLIVELE